MRSRVYYGDNAVIEETQESFKAFVAQEQFAHYICDARIEELQRYILYLRTVHFTEAHNNSELFILRLIEWRISKWVVISVPQLSHETMAAAAYESGLEVVGGIPFVINGNDVFIFPTPKDRSFALSRKSDCIIPSPAVTIAIDEDGNYVRQLQHIPTLKH